MEIKEMIENNCESPSDNSHGDLVQLVWLIEKLRRGENKCTMNVLIMEAKRNFNGLENIKCIEP